LFHRLWTRWEKTGQGQKPEGFGDRINSLFNNTNKKIFLKRTVEKELWSQKFSSFLGSDSSHR